jgi:hypothetical protein
VEVTGRTQFEGKDWYRVALSGRSAYVFGSLLGRKVATTVLVAPPKATIPPKATPAVGAYPPPVEALRLKINGPQVQVRPNVKPEPVEIDRDSAVTLELDKRLRCQLKDNTKMFVNGIECFRKKGKIIE